MQYIKKVLPIFFLLFFLSTSAQHGGNSFQPGDFLKYKIHYGLLNAGFATVELKEKHEKSDTLIHAVGKGWTTGMVGFLFKVEDTYESYFSASGVKPNHFIRNINEGGYIANDPVRNRDTRRGPAADRSAPDRRCRARSDRPRRRHPPRRLP